MPTARKSIRLSPDEDDLLRRVYLGMGIPSDQYAKRPPEDLARFIRRWNTLSERSDPADDIQHYIKTKRKRGLWVTFDGAHTKMPKIDDSVLTPTQWAHLDSVYDELCASRSLGSDNIDHNDDLAKEFAAKFARLTGLVRAGRWLLALIMQKRKRGEWRKIENEEDRGIGFGDIDDIAI